MIPIEELKLSRRDVLENTAIMPFDDTYWGIETQRCPEWCAWFHLLMIPIEELKLLNLLRCRVLNDTLLMIPIEELKPSLGPTFFLLFSFWWYLLRNWNLVTRIRQMLTQHPFDDTYWGIETNINHCQLRFQISFDDTYWGIETLHQSVSFCFSFLPFDDTYWGIETCMPRGGCNRPDGFWWYLLRNWNLPAAWIWRTFRNFWWYLLRNWNSENSSTATLTSTFDDTYWGIETSDVLTDCIHSLGFWWYLLRNWNCCSICAGRFGGHTFDDTYWGIETLLISKTRVPQAIFWWYLLRNWNLVSLLSSSKRSSFWWYLLRNWNSSSPCTSSTAEILLMIPIEELKPGLSGQYGISTPLLMIPIEELKRLCKIQNCLCLCLLMIPIEELKPVPMAYPSR